MRKPLLLLLAAIVCLSGCAGQVKQTEDPFAGLGKAAPALRESSVTVILDDNTKATRAFATTGMATQEFNYDGKAVMGDVAEMFRRDFKSVTFVESDQDPRLKQSDVVATLDIQRSEQNLHPVARLLLIPLGPFGYPIMFAVTWFAYPTQMTVTIRSQAGGTLATLSEKTVKSNKGLTDRYQQFRNGLRDCRIGVERQLLTSRELDAYLRKLHPDAPASPLIAQLPNAAPKIRTWTSAVDSAKYKRAPDDALVALVIGIDQYASVPEAAFAERDAAAVREHLLALGYAPRNVAVLTGDLASKASIEKYVESWLPSRLKPGSRVFVYFAGHGTPDLRTGKPNLLPYDGDPRYLDETAYPLDRLYAQLGALHAPTLVALDSGFSGTGPRSVLPAGTRPLLAKLDTARPPAGVTVVTAAASDEQAGISDKEGHGLFTYWLLRGLDERGGDGAAKPLFAFLKPRVEDAARQATQDQTPQWLGADGALLR